MKSVMILIQKNVIKIALSAIIVFMVANSYTAEAAGKGYVSFTFDDGLISAYEIAYPILKENNCPATAYITTDWIDERVRGFMNWDKIRVLQNEGGWEIGNHTANHDFLWKKKFSKKYIQRDINRSQKAFAVNGIERPVSFAPPYGKWGSRLMSVVKSSGFTTSRRAWAVNDYSNNPANFNRWALDSMNLKSEVSFEKARTEIDYAARNGRWIVFTVHNVVNGEPKRNEYSAVELRRVAEYVNSLQRSGKLEALPVGEVFSRL